MATWATSTDMSDYYESAVASFTTAQMNAKLALAERMIENRCDRTFAETEYFEWLDGTDSDMLVLPQYPVTAFYQCTDLTELAFSIQNTSSDADEATVEVSDDKIFLSVYGGTNSGSTGLALSSYSTLADLEAAIEGLNLGWEIEVVNEEDPRKLKPYGVGACLNVPYYVDVAYNSYTGVSLNADQGILYRRSAFPVGFKNIFVHYKAGYSTIPDILKDIEMQLAFKLLTRDMSDPTMRSERLGDYAYTKDTDAQMDVFAWLDDQLTPYMKLRV